jgi:hypothetical protein
MADIFEALMAWLGQLQQNVIDTFSQLTVEKYIRLVVIVGAYALLRSYILKLAGKQQTKEHEKEVDPREVASAAGAGIPRPLRDQVQVPDDSDEEDGQVTGTDWGKKARKRQRQMVRKILEADEKLRKEKEGDEEDKDIEEFLVG